MKIRRYWAFSPYNLSNQMFLRSGCKGAGVIYSVTSDMFLKAKTAGGNDKFMLDITSDKVFQAYFYNDFKLTTVHNDDCQPNYNYFILENISTFKRLYATEANMTSVKSVDFFLGSKLMQHGFDHRKVLKF